jgi:hypothetical protein
VRRDLVFSKLPISLGGARRDIARRLPLVNALSHKLSNGHLGTLDVGSIYLLHNQPLTGFLGFSLAVAIFELVPASFALSAFEHVNDAVPSAPLPSLANMSAHFRSPSSSCFGRIV